MDSVPMVPVKCKYAKSLELGIFPVESLFSGLQAKASEATNKAKNSFFINAYLGV